MIVSRATLVLGVLAALGAQAQQFRRTVASVTDESTLCVTWADRNFDYRVDQDGSSRTPGETEFTAIDASFANWQAVSDTCSEFKFIRGARLAGGRVGRGTETENLVIFRETSCRDVVAPSDGCLADGSCGNVHRCWDHSDGTIGLTTVTYSTRTGVAIDADIELNAGGFLFTTISSPPCEVGREATTCVAYDVQNTTTHEIGHAVGFDHVDDPSSTMAPTAPVGETAKRVIDVGTASGFCQTYPRGQPPVPCDELAVLRSRIIARNTGTFGLSCVASTSSAAPALALVGLMLLRRRRARFAPGRD
ncbi:MAG: myxosortase-dependent metalloprotease, MXAN_2677/MXAN_2678 family [Archangium sp.]|nr:myxosortase-dependent metalloprotease, MXAN_2677/MXAN_2678 family [Archangium sp.]